MANINKEIKDALGTGKVLIGSRSVSKAAKKGALAAIVFATNCPESRRKDLENYASTGGFELTAFDGDATRLGEVCGKPFNVLMLGIRK